MTGNRRDRGSVSLWVAIIAPTVFVALGGLVLDGGRQLTARSASSAAATAAARAAVQQTPTEVFERHLNPALANARAQTELAARGQTGTVDPVGETVTVTVTATVDYLLLPGSGTVTGTATAHAASGLRTQGG